MSDHWRQTLEKLGKSFERVACLSQGVFHTMVERKQIETGDRVSDSDEPPRGYWTKEDRASQWQKIDSLPGDPPRLRQLTPEEAATAPPPEEGDKYIRDRRGVPHAVHEPAVIRTGFLMGYEQAVHQFGTLADAAGRTFRSLPADVIALLPQELGELARPRGIVQRRLAFGDVEGHRPPWMGQGWQGGMAIYEKGVIVDFTEAGTGSDEGDSAWLLLLHRLGWRGGYNSLVRARAYYWLKNHSIRFDPLKPEKRHLPQEIESDILQGVPTHRFYSVIGDSDSEKTDLCWASTWAIDQLLNITNRGFQTSEEIGRQLTQVENSSTANEKGKSLEQLMRLLFESVEGFRVRESNLRTETEEIDLAVENKSLQYPWSRESPLIFVECKNWTKRIGKDEIVLFQTKMQNRRGRGSVGLFVGWGGFADTVGKELLRGSREDWLMLLLNGEDVKRAATGGTFTALLEQAWYDAITR